MAASVWRAVVARGGGWGGAGGGSRAGAEITEHTIEAGDEFLVIASDGLWTDDPSLRWRSRGGRGLDRAWIAGCGEGTEGLECGKWRLMADERVERADEARSGRGHPGRLAVAGELRE